MYKNRTLKPAFLFELNSIADTFFLSHFPITKSTVDYVDPNQTLSLSVIIFQENNTCSYF